MPRAMLTRANGKGVRGCAHRGLDSSKEAVRGKEGWAERWLAGPRAGKKEEVAGWADFRGWAGNWVWVFFFSFPFFFFKQTQTIRIQI